ncbi:MAG: hypothetical protein IKU44_04675 [Firmicutes bacterium]|nr:hypothetical protein [Bacillota bacterium]
MMKRILTSLCLLILFSGILCFATSCETESENDAPDIQSIDITVNIEYPKKAKIEDLQQESFTIEEESTILETIELYGNVNNISVLVDTTNNTLEGIHGIINQVYIEGYTWQCTVNDHAVKSIAKKELKDGDIVTFKYTK